MSCALDYIPLVCNMKLQNSKIRIVWGESDGNLFIYFTNAYLTVYLFGAVYLLYMFVCFSTHTCQYKCYIRSSIYFVMCTMRDTMLYLEFTFRKIP